MNQYKEKMQDIHPDIELIHATKRKMREAAAPKAVHKRAFNRRLIALVAAIVGLSSTLTAIASNKLVLSDVNKTAVFDGIEMTITDVNIETDEQDIEQREKGEILLTLRDTESKNRINRYTDIAEFDVRGFKSDGCEMVDFDSKTGIATYSLKVYDWPHGGIDYFNKRGKITVKSIVTNRKQETVDTRIDIAANLNKNASSNGNIAFGIIDADSSMISYTLTLLNKDEMNLPLESVKWLRITNMAMTAKNHLNIQVERIGDMRDYNMAELVLKDKDGNVIKQLNQDVHSEVDYHSEFIFEVTEAELKDCTLFAEIYDYSEGEAVNGQWETVFHK